MNQNKFESEEDEYGLVDTREAEMEIERESEIAREKNRERMKERYKKRADRREALCFGPVALTVISQTLYSVSNTYRPWR